MRAEMLAPGSSNLVIVQPSRSDPFAIPESTVPTLLADPSRRHEPSRPRAGRPRRRLRRHVRSWSRAQGRIVLTTPQVELPAAGEAVDAIGFLARRDAGAPARSRGAPIRSRTRPPADARHRRRADVAAAPGRCGLAAPADRGRGPTQLSDPAGQRRRHLLRRLVADALRSGRHGRRVRRRARRAAGSRRRPPARGADRARRPQRSGTVWPRSSPSRACVSSGDGSMPEPDRAPIDRLLSGRYDSRWIEVRGRRAIGDPAGRRRPSAAHVPVRRPPAQGARSRREARRGRCRRLVDSRLTIRGVCGSDLQRPRPADRSADPHARARRICRSTSEVPRIPSRCQPERSRA